MDLPPRRKSFKSTSDDDVPRSLDAQPLDCTHSMISEVFHHPDDEEGMSFFGFSALTPAEAKRENASKAPQVVGPQEDWEYLDDDFRSNKWSLYTFDDDTIYTSSLSVRTWENVVLLEDIPKEARKNKTKSPKGDAFIDGGIINHVDALRASQPKEACTKSPLQEDTTNKHTKEKQPVSTGLSQAKDPIANSNRSASTERNANCSSMPVKKSPIKTIKTIMAKLNCGSTFWKSSSKPRKNVPLTANHTKQHAARAPKHPRFKKAQSMRSTYTSATSTSIYAKSFERSPLLMKKQDLHQWQHQDTDSTCSSDSVSC